MAVTRGGLGLSIAAALAGPLLAAAPAHAAAAQIGRTQTGLTRAPTSLEQPGPARLGQGPTGGPAVTAQSVEAPSSPMPVGAPAPDPSGERVFVEVSPSTVQPGFLVGIRASCRDNSVPAIVWSDAFGRVQVQPQNGLLTATPMVRERTLTGNYRVKLECPDGATASTMLQVVDGVRPSRGPATGFGGAAGGFTGGLLLPGGLALTVTGLVVWLLAIRRPRTVRGAARR